MNDHTSPSTLKEDSNQLKEKINATHKQKRNLWWVDIDIRKEYGLSFIEAGFFGMIMQLQCSKEGFCRAKNYYFIDNLGISNDWIERAIKKLKERDLIWVHYYNTRNGMRRQIVTDPSIRRYQRFLKKNKSWKILKKFQDEFAFRHGPPDSPDDPSKSIPENTQVIDNLPSKGTYGADRKKPDDPDRKKPDAINTLYLPTRKNSVTCKSAASSSDLKEELEKVFPANEAAIGLEWYNDKSDAQKAAMRNPIACAIKAVKEGYAHTEVVSKHAEVAAQLAKKRDEEAKRRAKHEQMKSNENLANYLINKLSHLHEWKHRIDKCCISIFNSSLERERNDEIGLFTRMPDGSLLRGHHGVRADFNLPSREFKARLLDFLKKNLWIKASLEELIAI